jgi:hypothetical protein
MKRYLVFAVLVLMTPVAATQASALEIGARAGYTADETDQFHIGGHFTAAKPFLGFSLVPSLEIGFGDEVTLFAINGDLLYTFPELATAEWSLYAGGGPALNLVKVDHGEDHEDFGLNAVGGVVRKLKSGNDLLLELRLGLEDSPDFKITAGLTFF